MVQLHNFIDHGKPDPGAAGRNVGAIKLFRYVWQISFRNTTASVAYHDFKRCVRNISDNDHFAALFCIFKSVVQDIDKHLFDPIRIPIHRSGQMWHIVDQLNPFTQCALPKHKNSVIQLRQYVDFLHTHAELTVLHAGKIKKLFYNPGQAAGFINNHLHSFG